MSKPFTHITITDRKNDVDSLYRKQDGRLIGCRVQNQVFIGDEPNPEKCVIRRFLDQGYAKAHLRQLADEDWKIIASRDLPCECPTETNPIDIVHLAGCPKHPGTEFCANIEESDGTKMIVPASNMNGISLAKH